MQITKNIIKEILDGLEECMEQDSTNQDALGAYLKVVSPDSYSPVLSSRMTDGFIEGMLIAFPGLREDIDYYIYEARGSKHGNITTGGKKFDVSTRKGFERYLNNEFVQTEKPSKSKTKKTKKPKTK